MDHTQFKANQTAATYVADGLDEGTLEAFEMHMMGCTECIEDVEAWRAIKLNMPRATRPALAPAAIRRSVHAAAGWRMAASLPWTRWTTSVDSCGASPGRRCVSDSLVPRACGPKSRSRST